MTRQSLAAYRRTVTVEWPRAIDEDARQFLVRTAKEGHASIVREAETRSGVKPAFTAFANRPGRPVEAVILPGPIVYRYSYIREVVVAALTMLRQASPVRSGRYREAHTLFINGQPVKTIPETLSEHDDIMIANPLPYARRLEVGKTESGRDFLVSVPNRIYERTAKALQSRFRAVAIVKPSYATIPAAYVSKGALPPAYWTSTDPATRIRRRRRQHEWRGKPVRSPAIVIRAA